MTIELDKDALEKALKLIETENPSLSFGLMGIATEVICAYLTACRPDDATERLRLEAENARLQGLIRAILAADERGQGLPFADAMDAAQEAVYGKRT